MWVCRVCGCVTPEPPADDSAGCPRGVDVQAALNKERKSHISATAFEAAAQGMWKERGS